MQIFILGALCIFLMIQLVDLSSKQSSKETLLVPTLSMLPEGKGRERGLGRFSQRFESKSSYFSSMTFLFLSETNSVRVNQGLGRRWSSLREGTFPTFLLGQPSPP